MHFGYIDGLEFYDIDVKLNNNKINKIKFLFSKGTRLLF